MKRRATPLLLLATLLSALAVTGCDRPEIDAGVWPQFRGPQGQGIATRSTLPHHWTPEEGIRWRTDLPDGIAQPIVSGDRIFVTGGEYVEPEVLSRVVMGLDAASGEILWQTDVLTAPSETLHYKFSSVAMASPVTDGETVFAYFGPRLAALSRDGEVLWNETIDPQYWDESRYGAASSPLLVDDRIIILRDLENGQEDPETPLRSWLAAYSKQDGSLLWQTRWKGTCCSYVTPTLAVREDGSRQVLVTSSPLIKGFDLETGAELWSVDYPSVQVVPSSSIVGDLFIASGAVHARLTAGFRLVGSGAATTVERLWTETKAVPEIASPVVYDGTLYQVTEAGVATALDIQTGQPLKRWRLPPGPYRASMFASDGKIFALSARGTVSIWHAAPSLEMVATNHLPVDTGPYLSMAAAEDCLLLRSRRALYCVEGSAPEDAVPVS